MAEKAKIKEENTNLPNYIMINPRRAAMFEDTVSGVKLSLIVPNQYYAKTPKDKDCSTIRAGLWAGRLIPLNSPSEAEAHLLEAKVEVPPKPVDENTKTRLQQILATKDVNVLTTTIRSIVDEQLLKTLLIMETGGDNATGIVRHQIVDVIKSQLSSVRGPARLAIEPIPEEETA